MCAGTKLACVAVTAALATTLAVFALVAIVNKQQPSGDGVPAAETALRGQMTREQIEKAVEQARASEEASANAARKKAERAKAPKVSPSASPGNHALCDGEDCQATSELRGQMAHSGDPSIECKAPNKQCGIGKYAKCCKPTQTCSGEWFDYHCLDCPLPPCPPPPPSTELASAETYIRIVNWNNADCSGGRINSAATAHDVCMAGPSPIGYPEAKVSEKIVCSTDAKECTKFTYNNGDCSGDGTVAQTIPVDGSCTKLTVGMETLSFKATIMSDLNAAIEGFEPPLMKAFAGNTDCSGQPVMVAEQGACRSLDYTGTSMRQACSSDKSSIEMCWFNDDQCAVKGVKGCRNFGSSTPGKCQAKDGNSLTFSCE